MASQSPATQCLFTLPPEQSSSYRYVARQPILDLRGRVHGYELLFRNGPKQNAFSGDGDLATRTILDNMVMFGIEKLTGGLPAFVNCTREAAGIAGTGDERERRRWDRAQAIAYDTLSWMLIVAFVVVWIRELPNPLVPLLGQSSKTIVDNLTTALVMGGLIAYFTLPQAIFLWTEPDMEETRP
jgi:hypothetical protein